MKEHPIIFSSEMVAAILEGRKTMTRRIVKHANWCPYGQVGDHLWVRETWRGGDDTLESVWYRASGDLCTDKGHVCLCKWRPSIFMPRKFSRITLEITDIKVERLQEITEEDAKAEGIERTNWIYSCEPYRNYREPRMAPGRNCSTAVMSFLTLWDSINGKKYPYILPIRKYPLLIGDPTNGIVLCKTCHDKTKFKEHRYAHRFLNLIGENKSREAVQ